MASIANLASDETLVREAYERVKGDWAELEADQLLQINLEIQLAVQTILGAWPEIKAQRARIEALSSVDMQQFDKLEDYALALIHVQARFTMASKPSDDLDELVEQANKLRDTLYADAQALVHRSLFDPRKLSTLKGGNSYRNLATDLQALASELEAIFPNIQGKAGITLEELRIATQTATRLTRVVGVREQAPVVVAALVDERLRAFTQVINAYEEARAAIGFVRRREGDANEIAPNLYTANVVPRKRSEPEPMAPVSGPAFGQPPVVNPPGGAPSLPLAVNGTPVTAAGTTSEPFGA